MLTWSGTDDWIVRPLRAKMGKNIVNNYMYVLLCFTLWSCEYQPAPDHGGFIVKEYPVQDIGKNN